LPCSLFYMPPPLVRSPFEERYMHVFGITVLLFFFCESMGLY
jgi:hypothetical protein